MSSSKKKCKLCFCSISTDDFEVIEDTTIDMLNVLSLKLNLDQNARQLLCGTCSRQLLSAFVFKSTCIHIDSIISHFSLEKPAPVDLRDIVVKERDDKKAFILPEDEEICRLCMELTGKMFVPLFESEMELLRKFLPEIEVTTVKDPVLCKACFDSLLTHSGFLKNCSNIQNGKPVSIIPQTMGIEGGSSLEVPMKMEEVDVKYEEESAINCSIGPEAIDIDSVKNDQTSIKIEHIDELCRSECPLTSFPP